MYPHTLKALLCGWSVQKAAPWLTEPSPSSFWNWLTQRTITDISCNRGLFNTGYYFKTQIYHY